MVLAPANDALFRKLLTVIGRHDLLEDPRFGTNAGRVEHRAECDGLIGEATAKWSRDALLAACAKAGVPAGPINAIDEVFADPQVISRGMRIAPEGMQGVRSPFTFSDAELALDRPSPRHGEHRSD